MSIPRREFLAWLLLAGVARYAPARETPSVAVTPLTLADWDALPDDRLLDAVRERIRATYRLDAYVAPPQHAPVARPYRAGALLDTLAAARPREHLLGVTTAPLRERMPDGVLRGVSGYANAPGTAAVITTHWRGGGPDARAATRRVTAVALHELAHNLGAGDCDDLQCLLYNDPTGQRRAPDTDRVSFCRAHHAALSHLLR